MALLLTLTGGCGAAGDVEGVVRAFLDAGDEERDGGADDAEAPEDDGGPQDADTTSDAEVATSSDASVGRALSIEPAEATLDLDGGPASLQFTASLGSDPLAHANWSVDMTRLGTIDADGVFHSDGLVAGSVTITAQFGSMSTTTTLTLRTKAHAAVGGVTPEQQTALDATPTAAADFRLLYPYAGTVFPRGLPGPVLQFTGPADAARVSLRVGDFSYTGDFGFAAGESLPQIELPQAVWDALTLSADGSKEVEVELVKLVDGAAVGPISSKWRVAPGDLKGIIYYNTYKSATTNTGAVMRIKPGDNAEVMLGTDGCTVCHSVSAQGNVLVAGLGWGDNNPIDSASFDLAGDGTAALRYKDEEGRKFAFGALSPDGTFAVGNAVPKSGSPVRGLQSNDTYGDYPTQLYKTSDGSVVDAPSLTSQVTYAETPAFAPDGSRLVFSWNDDNRDAKTLAMMDVDLTSDPPSFTAPLEIAQLDTASTLFGSGRVGWPSFLPDAKGVVYQEGQNFDTGLFGAKPSYAELRLVDTEMQVVNALKTLNGWNADDSSSLPFGVDEDNNRNYEPSVLPIPVGGYYWVIFTSRRTYGHTLAPGGSVAGSDNEWGLYQNDTETPSARKKLWVAAIDLDYSGKGDPSHPAFYLPGQELEAGNMRAYTALSPCKQEGDTCESGAECCEGFCRVLPQEVGDPVYTCVPPPVGCSNVDELCETDADCCGAASGDTCINHHCAVANIVIN